MPDPETDPAERKKIADYVRAPDKVDATQPLDWSYTFRHLIEGILIVRGLVGDPKSGHYFKLVEGEPTKTPHNPELGLSENSNSQRVPLETIDKSKLQEIRDHQLPSSYEIVLKGYILAPEKKLAFVQSIRGGPFPSPRAFSRVSWADMNIDKGVRGEYVKQLPDFSQST